MISIESLTARVDTLEMRAMHQDRIIEDLNATITTQWRQIDALRRQIESLDNRMRETAESLDRIDATPPPHY